MPTYWEEQLNNILTWIMIEEQFTKEELSIFKRLRDEINNLMKDMEDE